MEPSHASEPYFTAALPRQSPSEGGYLIDESTVSLAVRATSHSARHCLSSLRNWAIDRISIGANEDALYARQFSPMAPNHSYAACEACAQDDACDGSMRAEW